MNDITLLIHGPRSTFTTQVITQACRALKSGQIAHAIFAGYEADLPAISAQIRAFDGALLGRFNLISAPDVSNPGIANLNRQINLVNAGLAAIGSTDLVIKLRSDQCCSFRDCLVQIARFSQDLQAGKLLTTNCYTRSDRLYHPSDMFLIATPDTLRTYYPQQLFPQTQLDDLLAIGQDVADGASLAQMQQWPEARLFRHLLTRRGWTPLETPADSSNALHTHCIILDARQIGLRWEKFYLGRIPLVPYRFHVAPFPKLPEEDCRCVRAADFGACPNGLSNRTEWLTRLLWHRNLDALRTHGDWKATIRTILGINA